MIPRERRKSSLRGAWEKGNLKIACTDYRYLLVQYAGVEAIAIGSDLHVNQSFGNLPRDRDSSKEHHCLQGRSLARKQEMIDPFTV